MTAIDVLHSSHKADGLDVKNSAFLRAVSHAAPLGSSLWVTHFYGNPGPTSSWGGQPYRPDGVIEHQVDEWRDYNTYFSVGAVKPDAAGELSRRKANFARLLVLVVDDADPQDLTASPSWVLRTSPGKQQVGFFLDGNDPDCENLPLVSALVTRMAGRGLIGGDKSGNNVIRYVRLPVGQNQKPREDGHWQCHLEQWSPNVRYSLADAAQSIGIDIDELKAELAANPQLGTSTGSISGPQDEKLRVLARNIALGENLHDSINETAASLVASGMHGGAIVNMLRGMMDASQAPRDQRWQDRYNDIGRSVATAEEKFRPRQSAPQVDPETGEKPTLLVDVDSLLGDLKGVDWLVKGWLEREAVSMVYGQSGAGKSFFALDWACCVATGTPWRGMPVKQGLVVYVAGEGHNGLRRRLAAWQQANGVSLKGAPLYISKKAVPFLDADAVNALDGEIAIQCATRKTRCALIQIDTLARNFGDGDENSSADASRFVEALDALKYGWECHVMVIHHTGHDKSRARGSYALVGAVDQNLEVAPLGENVALTCHKMKDGEKPEPRLFKLDRVVLGEDDEGNTISSCVLITAGDPLAQAACKDMLGNEVPVRAILLGILDNWIGRETSAAKVGCNTKQWDVGIRVCVSLGFAQKLGKANSAGYGVTQKAKDIFANQGAIVLDPTSLDGNAPEGVVPYDE